MVKTIQGISFFPLLAVFLWCALSCKHGPDENLVKHYTESLFDSTRVTAAKQGRNTALRFIDSVYGTFSATSIADKFSLYLFKSSLYDENGDLNFENVPEKNNALKYLDSSLYIIEEAGETTGLAKDYASALAKKALFCLYDGEFDVAGELLSKSKQICQETGNYCTLAQISDYVGSILYEQNRFVDALNYYKEAYNNIQRCDGSKFDKFYETQGNLDNTGLCYIGLGQADSALIFFARDTDFIEKNKYIYAENNNQNFPKSAKVVALSNMAQAFLEKKNYTEALEKFSESIDITKNNLNNRANFMAMADAYLSMNKPDIAYTWIMKADSGYAATSNYAQLTLSQDKSRYYMEKGNRALENKYLLQTIALKDTLALEEHNLFGHNLLDVFEHDEKQKQLLILQKDEKIKLVYIWTSIGFVAVVLLLCGLFYYNWKKSSQSVRRFTILGKKVRQREMQLSQLVNDLRVKTEQKERTLRLVVHDLRSPLSNIKMLTAIRQEDKSLANNDYVNLAKLASTDALRLVDEILATDAGDSEISPVKVPTDINSFINDCTSLMRVAAAEKGQNILFFPLLTTPIIDCDPEMIRRVINNIIGNAIKFSTEGKNIAVTIMDGNQMVTIAIEDEGIGIGKKNNENLFDPFTIAKRQGTKGEKSFGLGLSICKKVIDMHDGKLWFSSQVNKGTTFYIELKK